MKRIIFLAVLVALLLGCSKDTSNPGAGPQAKEGTVLESSVNNEDVVFTVEESTGAEVTATLEYGDNEITVNGKITSDGMSDYVYSNGDKSKPFKLVDYGDNVGETWSFNIGTKEVTRTVTYKSDTDDTYIPALGLYIKIIEVTEEIPSGINVMGEPSVVKKIIWRFNHKFGFVGATVIKNDNTEVNVPLMQTNVQYN